MRIETWLIKAGDGIIVYSEHGVVYKGTVIRNPWEMESMLFIRFKVHIQDWTNSLDPYGRGLAEFSDERNQWELVGNLSTYMARE